MPSRSVPRPGPALRVIVLLLFSGGLTAPAWPQGPAGLRPTAREQELAREEFLQLCRSRLASRRAHGVRQLGEMDFPWRVEELLRVLQRERPGRGGEEVIRATAEVLGSTREPDSVAALIQALITEGRAEVRRLVLRALAQIPLRPEAHRELPWAQLDTALRDGLQGEDPLELVGSLEAVASLRRASLRDLVLPHLEHPAVPVQSAAIRALRDCFSRKDPQGLAELVALLPHRRGRIRRELREALTRMTGWSCDRDLDCWQQRFERWREEGETPGDDGAPEEAPGSRTRVTFLGMPLESNRLLLVVDVSSSMAEPCHGTASSWELARGSLIEAIDALEPDQFFTILLFADGVSWWRDELVQATERNRDLAIRRLQRQTIAPGSQTNFHAALTEAFTLAGPAVLQKDGPVGVDTIVFLTDGMPTVGEISLRTPVLDARDRPIVQNGKVRTIGVDQCYDRLAALVEWINQHGQVTIDTVGIGEEQAQVLLQRLAVHSGGKYTDATLTLARRARQPGMEER